MHRIVTVFLLSVFFSICAQAADLAKYKQIAQASIDKVKGGNVSDVDKIIADQQQLMEIGLEAINEHVKKSPADAPVLNLVKENAKKMPSLSLSEIEAQWHEKGVLKSKGLDATEESTVGSLMDTVVHPATVIIVMKDFQKTKDAKNLEQAQDELKEVIGHLSHIQ